MLCPECKKSDTRVVDSRDDQRIVRRRRECLKCHFRFSTYEHIESPKIKIIKRNGEAEDYTRGKLAHGIKLALEKRPVTPVQVENLIDTIEHELTKFKSKFVSSKQVGQIVIEKLKEVDEVGYLRFLSVYKSFGSASKFQKEAEKLAKR